MFIGHFALGYAAKRWVPQESLAVLFAAPLFADLVWPILVAAGIEHVRIVPGITAATPLEFISYPYSHSLAMLVVWGVLFGWIRARRTRMRDDIAAGTARKVFVVMFVLVVSHWLLDYVTHLPDLPLYPGGPTFGLGLWRSVAGTIAVEVTMFLIGVWMYVRVTAARDAVGLWVFAGLTAFLLIGFVATLGGPPPPSVTALWVMAVALSLVTLALAWWADKHRIRRIR